MCRAILIIVFRYYNIVKVLIRVLGEVFMETFRDFILRNKRNLILFVFGFILISVFLATGVFIYKNQSLKEVVDGDLSAESLTEVPEGFIPIRSADDLASVANDLSGKYILMNSIDMAGVDYIILGQSPTSAFTGTFDGNGYTISNLTVESDSAYVGMFGYINGGTVKNLTLQDINVRGTISTSNSTAYIAGLAGYVTGSTSNIENVNVIGNSVITDTENGYNSCIGAVIGYFKQGIVKASSSAGKVSSNSKGIRRIGGLIGDNSGKIENCNSIAEVINNSESTSACYMGGLLGTGGGVTQSNSKGIIRQNSEIQSDSCIGRLSWYWKWYK